MAGRVKLHVVANFEDNLETIREFLEEADASEAFDSLLDRLFDIVIPTIEGFPLVGADFN